MANYERVNIRPIRASTDKAIDDFLKKAPPGSVLDLGSGTIEAVDVLPGITLIKEETQRVAESVLNHLRRPLARRTERFVSVLRNTTIASLVDRTSRPIPQR